MIKKFDSDNGEWLGKRINFVDQNNILIGYDFSRECCEEFGYEVHCNLDNSEFTTKFEINETIGDAYDNGIKAEAKFFTCDTETKESNGYIVFTIAHNGFYSHGFTMSKGDDLITKGDLGVQYH